MCVCVCVSVCVCSFVILEIASFRSSLNPWKERKNVGPSDKNLWRFLLTFVTLKFCFLGFVHRHNKLFFSYLWSFVCKFISSEEIQI